MIKILSLVKYLYIHPLLWVVIGLAIATGHFRELLLLLCIIIVHEFGHAAAAAHYNWRIKRIALLPFGGVAEMDEHGNRPLREELMVILAGPLQHVWLIGGAALLHSVSWMSADVFQLFVHYNLMILVFNLLPIWPLDGGKLIFLFYSSKLPFPAAHKKTIYLSISSLAVFMIFFLFTGPFNLNIWIVAAFLAFSLYYEWKQTRYTFMRFLLQRYYGKHTDIRILKPIVVDEQDKLIDVLDQFQRGCKHPIVIEQDGSEKGTLDENELLHAYFSEKLVTAKIGDIVYLY